MLDKATMAKQGVHPDPLEPGTEAIDPSSWTSLQRQAHESGMVALYRRGLQVNPEADIRKSILDDLGTFYHMDPRTCVERCRNWEEWSVQEWEFAHQESHDGIADYYRTTISLSFDLIWYAYLQAEGYQYPVSAVIGTLVPPGGPRRRHLDFGSGIGATCQLFQGLGYETTLADISTSTLAFARHRLERRHCPATYLDLNRETLPEGEYDVITAIDTLVHVPDVRATVRRLHAALRPGGLLFANFDVRVQTRENAWHLYSDDLPLRWQVQRTGFEPVESLDGMITKYAWVAPFGPRHAVRGLRDLVLLRSPLRPVVRKTRSWLRAVRGQRAQT